jgi:FlaA1/EpsC-like NDP-sugar epimerase
MRDVDIVFHAAALKHVELSEYNPFEAVKTNVLGAQHVIKSALHMGVEIVLNMRTDKASMPVAVMGATG